MLMSRHRDNLYLVFANIPPNILPAVRLSVAALLRSVYGIALKWGVHGTDSNQGGGVGGGSSPHCGGFQPRLAKYLSQGVMRKNIEFCGF